MTVLRAEEHGDMRGVRSGGSAAAAMLLFLGLLFCAFGVLSLQSVSWGRIATHFAAQDWPTAAAIVEEVTLQERLVPSSRGDTRAETLVLSVRYRYEVDGVAHTGLRASLADEDDIRDRRLKALYLAISYARVAGHAIPARYDPADPAEAYLDISLPWRPIALAGGLGVAFVLIGLAFMVALLRERRSASDPD